jgi:hypothetical protein
MERQPRTWAGSRWARPLMLRAALRVAVVMLGVIAMATTSAGIAAPASAAVKVGDIRTTATMQGRGATWDGGKKTCRLWHNFVVTLPKGLTATQSRLIAERVNARARGFRASQQRKYRNTNRMASVSIATHPRYLGARATYSVKAASAASCRNAGAAWKKTSNLAAVGNTWWRGAASALVGAVVYVTTTTMLAALAAVISPQPEASALVLAASGCIGGALADYVSKLVLGIRGSVLIASVITNCVTGIIVSLGLGPLNKFTTTRVAPMIRGGIERAGVTAGAYARWWAAAEREAGDVEMAVQRALNASRPPIRVV